LCIECLKLHDSTHILSKDFKASKKICFRCTDEVLKFQCTSCSKPCCFVCEKTHHSGHKLEPIKDFYNSKKEKLKEIQLPYQTFNEFHESLNKTKLNVISKLKQSSSDVLNKIDDMISNLKDLYKLIEHKTIEKEAEIEKEISILENIFLKLYYDINNTSIDDFIKLYLLGKIPKKFSDIVGIQVPLGNYNGHINNIKSEIDLIKNENNLYWEKLHIFNYNYNFEIESVYLNSKPVNSLTQKTTNDILVSASYDRIYLHNINDNFQILKELSNGDLNNVLSMFTLPNNNRIVIGSSKGKFFVYDQNLEKLEKHIYDIHTKETSCVIYIKHNNKVACASLDGNIKILETSYWNIEKNLSIDGSPVRTLLYLEEKNLLLSGLDNNTIGVYDVKNDFNHLKYLKEHKNAVHSMIELKYKKWASGCTCCIKIWDENLNCIKNINAHSSVISCLKTLSNGSLVSGSHDKTFKIWDVNYKYVCLKSIEVASPIFSLCILNSDDIVIGLENSKFQVWKSKALK
jgi:hypothetical protein